MTDTQAPEVFGEMLTELNEVCAIVEILKSINLEGIQLANEVDLTFLVNLLVNGCNLWTHLSEVSVEELTNPDYLAMIVHDMYRPVSYIGGTALLLSKIDCDDTEFSQCVNDLLGHSEVLSAAFEKMKQCLVSLRETKE